jgi:membrane-bound ClpP family serine protease
MDMNHSRILPALLAALILFFAASQVAAADRIERKDGRVLEGRIVEESKDSITIETRAGELMVRQRVSKANVRNVEREKREGPGYCVVPIEGVIGVEVTADALRKALLDAKHCGAKIIVLSVDSPGGLIDARDQLLNVMKEHKDLQFVGHVRRALSSAAVLALACPRLYMTPQGTMGAAVAYRVLPDGSAAPVEAKYRSAIEAGERAAAAMGGRSELWIRGMTEIDLELAIVNGADGNPKLVEAGTQWEGEKLIKRKGQILTLTADEAKNWGLSTGIARDLNEIRKLLAIDTWHNAGDGPASIMVAQAKQAQVRVQRAQEARKELLKLDSEAVVVLRRLDSAAKATEKIRADFNREVAPIVADTQAKVARARQTGAPQETIAAIEAAGQRKLDALRARYAQRSEDIQRAGNAAVKDLEALKARRAEILASLDR